jgi:hypothetical protein
MVRLSAAIAGIGGNLTAFSSWEGTQGPGRLGAILKVDQVSKEQLVATVKKLAEVEILHVREM